MKKKKSGRKKKINKKLPIHFIDASVILALYSGKRDEKVKQCRKHIFESKKKYLLRIAAHGWGEIINFVLGIKSEDAFNIAIKGLKKIKGFTTFIHPSFRAFKEAIPSEQAFHLKSSDALHLSTAIISSRRNPSKRGTFFITTDRRDFGNDRLKKYAKENGVKIKII